MWTFFPGAATRRVAQLSLVVVMALTGAIGALGSSPPAVEAAGMCTSPAMTSRVVTSSPGDHTITSEVTWKYRYYCNNPYMTPTETTVTRFYTRIAFNESHPDVVHELRYAALHKEGEPWTLHASYPVWQDYTIAQSSRCTGTCTMSRTYYPRTSTGALAWVTASRDNFVRVWCGCHNFPVGDASEALWHFYSRDSNKLTIRYLSSSNGCSSGWCP